VKVDPRDASPRESARGLICTAAWRSAVRRRTDHTVYRDSDDALPNEAFIDGLWQRVTPSEQDYRHMREITPAEAEGLIANGRSTENA